MKVLKWYEVKTPGYYWEFCEDGSTNIISVYNDSYSYTGNEQTFAFSEDDATNKYVLIEVPVLPVADYAVGYSYAELEHQRNNSDSRFPENVEGYWRMSVEPNNRPPGSYAAEVATYPWPYIWEIPEYDKQAFINRLADVEDLADKKLYRGFSICRITGVNRGNAEYTYKGWAWPNGYIEYVRLGVPPSRAFYAFIMGVPESDCMWLPTYGRDL